MKLNSVFDQTSIIKIKTLFLHFLDVNLDPVDIEVGFSYFAVMF